MYNSKIKLEIPKQNEHIHLTTKLIPIIRRLVTDARSILDRRMRQR